MKKGISVLVVSLLVLILSFSLTACSDFAGFGGKSAYEIALDNGFVGTEEEWLQSLVGKNGKDGVNAADNNGVDINELFQAYKELYPDATFADFLEDFLVIEYYDTEYASALGIQSAVSVYSSFTRRSNRPGQATEYSSGGAGIVYKIIDGYAYIITNYHVVYDRDSAKDDRIAHTIEAYSYGYESNGNGVTAEFLGGSITKDIAVIKAPTALFASNLREVQTADSNKVSLGERVVAIGNPLAEGISVTTGVISVDSEEIEMEALDSASSSISLRVLRTDTAINSGNSGGGLFNAKGELIGIVNAKTVESGVESMGYAIPVNVAIGIADSVMENQAKKCVLGVTVRAATSSTLYNPAENRVEIIESIAVESTTSALTQNKLLAGDKLISVRINDGEVFSLTRIFHLSDYLYKVRLGDTVYLEIEREGQILTVELIPEAENFSPV